MWEILPLLKWRVVHKEDDDIICIYDYSQMDVIGNVFDNPELLKNK